MQAIHIVGSAARVDGAQRYATGLTAAEASSETSLRHETLTISPLGEDWHTPLAAGRFRCGSGPIDALERAVALLRGGEADLVSITGEDPLRTGYTRDERVSRMDIYPELDSVAHGYDKLACLYLERKGIDRARFIGLRDALFDNYLKTFLAQKGARAPSPVWFEPVTDLFRGVDCANPVIDFKGELLLATQETARRLCKQGAAGPAGPAGKAAEKTVEIAGVATAALDRDGPRALEEIAEFRHLRRAVELAQKRAGVDISKAFNAGEVYFEAYTCFPVIPLALLLEAGISEVDGEGLEELVATKPLTITGGMNLARAPWNNPALRGLIAMHHKLLEGGKSLGIVHGNGGLGFSQGIAILRRV
jgi:hypothetical protein